MRIFIGWDSRMPDPGNVLAYSIKKHASRPFTIEFLDLSHLEKVHGFNRHRDPLQSTEFTYTRFLVPYLCGYQGKALFLDNDMLCLGDIAEIADLDMDDLALRVVQHDQQVTNGTKMDGQVQTSYPRKNWSSMMLMDCAKLQCWTKEAIETQTGAWCHRFVPIPDGQIGELPRTWNVLDEIKSDTKLVHYTEGGPWFRECADHPFGGPWYRYYYDLTHGR